MLKTSSDLDDFIVSAILADLLASDKEEDLHVIGDEIFEKLWKLGLFNEISQGKRQQATSTINLEESRRVSEIEVFDVA